MSQAKASIVERYISDNFHTEGFSINEMPFLSMVEGKILEDAKGDKLLIYRKLMEEVVVVDDGEVIKEFEFYQPPHIPRDVWKLLSQKPAPKGSRICA